MGTTILNTLIGLIIGALFTALVNKIKDDSKKEKEQTSDIALLKQGLCSMQRNTLLKECEYYLIEKYCPDDTKKVLYEMYKSYSSLGGDGIITTLVTQTMALAVEKEKL
jgi:hypothetical protein